MDFMFVHKHEKNMSKIKGKVIIDVERCKGCEVCVAACPSDVLSLSRKVNGKGYNYASVVKAEDCVGCASCALVCPDSCIVVYREKI